MEQVAKLKSTWNLPPSLPNFSKDYWKFLSLLISINWPTSWFDGDFMTCGSKDIFKNAPTNTYRDVTNLVNHGMAENIKTWISWERNIIIVRNKKILNLCFRCHILRSYHFVAEVTFKLLHFLWKTIPGLKSKTVLNTHIITIILLPLLLWYVNTYVWNTRTYIFV